RARKSSKERSCEDDEEGHLVYHVGLVMKERYEVVCTLGTGAFGKVVECLDRDKYLKRCAWCRTWKTAGGFVVSELRCVPQRGNAWP
ncbi:unnamed protein product, partial [Tetraodon nigroviridis]